MKLPTILLLCVTILTTSAYSTLDKSSKKKKNIIDELRLSVNRSSPKEEKPRPFRQIRLLDHERDTNGDVVVGKNHKRKVTVNSIVRQIMYARRRSGRFNLFLATYCNRPQLLICTNLSFLLFFFFWIICYHLPSSLSSSFQINIFSVNGIIY